MDTIQFSSQQRKLLYSWLLFAITAAGIAGTLAFLVAMTRTPGVRLLPSARSFQVMLIAHVTFALTIWLLTFISSVWAYVAGQSGVMMNRVASWIGFAVSILGTIIISIPLFTFQGDAVTTDYVPLLDTPLLRWLRNISARHWNHGGDIFSWRDSKTITHTRRIWNGLRRICHTCCHRCFGRRRSAFGHWRRWARPCRILSSVILGYGTFIAIRERGDDGCGLVCSHRSFLGCAAHQSDVCKILIHALRRISAWSHRFHTFSTIRSLCRLKRCGALPSTPV